MKIAVTGNIASGKSTVSNILEGLGYFKIDADKEAHLLYEEDLGLLEELQRAFGDHIVHDGVLDRKKMGSIVFSDPKELGKLNSIVHPRLHARIQGLLQKEQNVVLDAALIFEWDIQDWFDKVILVTASTNVRKQRLMERNGLSDEEAQKRMDCQMPQEKKEKLTSLILQNENLPREELQQRVKALL